MKRLPSTVRDHLVACAIKAGKDRKTFNALVGDTYRKIGQGAFRLVYDTGEFVIKLRRYKPQSSNDFPMRQINSSNADEMRGYKSIVRGWKWTGQFVLKPTLIRLPNGHNVIVMPKVDTIVRTLEDDGCDNDAWKDDAPETLVDQVTFIEETFRDAHTANIGILGRRAYLIDINFAGLFYGAVEDPKATEAWAKRLLDALVAPVKPKKKRAAECITQEDHKLLAELAA